MSDWEATLDSFERGESPTEELRELLNHEDLSPQGQRAVRQVLELATGLTTLLEQVGLAPDHADRVEQALATLPTPPTPPNDDEVIEDEDDPELARGLQALLGSMPSVAELSAAPFSEPPPTVSAGLAELLVHLEATAAGPGTDHFDRIDRSFCQSLPTSLLLRQTLADAVAACRASEATFWVLSQDGERLEGTLNHCLDGSRHEALEALDVPVSVSAIGGVITSGQAIRIGREQYQDPVVGWTVGVDVTAMIAAPVRLHGVTVGVLSAVNPQERDVFEHGALDGLRWRAHLLGLALAECLRGAYHQE